MPLLLPSYLHSRPSAGVAVAHAWGTGIAMRAFGSDNPVIQDKLGKLSFRALLGLSAAMGEWVRERFLDFRDDAALVQLIDATWAASVDFRYLDRDALAFPKDDHDPVVGPLHKTKRLLDNIIEIYSEVGFGIVRYVGAFVNFIVFLSPDPKPFKAWFKATVTRLATLSAPPAEESGGYDVEVTESEPIGVVEAVWGNPLPREFFDPAFDPAGADSATLLDALLVQVSATPNPFLLSPDVLRAQGFPGTPYRYPTS